MRIEKQNPGFAKRVKSWLTGKYVENGSTASQNIPAGKWVTWKGQVCRSKAAITAGDTLSSLNLGTEQEGMLNCFLLPTDFSSLGSDEEAVGKWTDGRTLYRKRYIATISGSGANYIDNRTNLQVVHVFGMGLTNTGYSIPLGAIAAYGGGLYVDGSQFGTTTTLDVFVYYVFKS